MMRSGPPEPPRIGIGSATNGSADSGPYESTFRVPTYQLANERPGYRASSCTISRPLLGFIASGT